MLRQSLWMDGGEKLTAASKTLKLTQTLGVNWCFPRGQADELSHFRWENVGLEEKLSTVITAW